MFIFEPTLDTLLKEIKGSKKVFISAPWIAPSRAKALVKSLSASCSLEVWLRMNPGETDKGELEAVFNALKYFDKIRICRNSNLHWKAYLCEKKGYVGSANFTERGVPDSIDDNCSIEALLELTAEQLKQCWILKETLNKKMQEFSHVDVAIEWWKKQRHKKVIKNYPDELPSIDDEIPFRKPSGFMR